MADPPYAVTAILDGAVDALLGGSSGYFVIPAGGKIACDWMPRPGCYRVTVDLVAGRPFSSEAEAFVHETRERLARIVRLT